MKLVKVRVIPKDYKQDEKKQKKVKIVPPTIPHPLYYYEAEDIDCIWQPIIAHQQENKSPSDTISQMISPSVSQRMGYKLRTLHKLLSFTICTARYFINTCLFRIISTKTLPQEEVTDPTQTQHPTQTSTSRSQQK